MQIQPPFLPMSLREAKALGITQFDIIIVTGDAYVDHPAFGAAIIGRVLWEAGYKVGLIAQPDWREDADFLKLGKPRLFFGVTSGNVDSMVNRYTPNLKTRSEDVYSPGGMLRRPNRAAIVYSNRLHALFPDSPIVLGGIEASLRRFAHYDYWSNSVRQSILADAPADLVVFGMGESSVTAIATRLDQGQSIKSLTDIAGTVIKVETGEWASTKHEGYVEMPSYTEVSQDKKLYAKAFTIHYQEQDPLRGRALAQPHPKMVIVQNKPALPLSSQELDRIYELPFSRLPHPSYKQPIPALEPVRFSLLTHRGCFGSCSFCALTHHQGRIVQSRSLESVVREAGTMTKMPSFKGIIQDVGGPTANMYGLTCERWNTLGACPEKACAKPLCGSLSTNHVKQVELLQKLREIPGVKRVFINSGIRYDLVLNDSSGYLEKMVKYHISGHLKVAPEHIIKHVTDLMGKPSGQVFEVFRGQFNTLNDKLGKKQYLLPYFMSGHPGCTIEDMIELAEYIRDKRLYTEQVQDFTPTPLSVSSCMYYTGLNPFTMREVHVAKGREKQIQRALLQYKDRKSYGLIYEGLQRAGRLDLIGCNRQCFIKTPK